MGLKNNLNY